VQVALAGDIGADLIASMPERDFVADPLSPGDRVAVSWSYGDAHELSH
jgi:hypothetical protein